MAANKITVSYFYRNISLLNTTILLFHKTTSHAIIYKIIKLALKSITLYQKQGFQLVLNLKSRVSHRYTELTFESLLETHSYFPMSYPYKP